MGIERDNRNKDYFKIEQNFIDTDNSFPKELSSLKATPISYESNKDNLQLLLITSFFLAKIFNSNSHRSGSYIDPTEINDILHSFLKEGYTAQEVREEFLYIFKNGDSELYRLVSRRPPLVPMDPQMHTFETLKVLSQRVKELGRFSLPTATVAVELFNNMPKDSTYAENINKLNMLYYLVSDLVIATVQEEDITAKKIANNLKVNSILDGLVKGVDLLHFQDTTISEIKKISDRLIALANETSLFQARDIIHDSYKLLYRNTDRLSADDFIKVIDLVEDISKRIPSDRVKEGRSLFLSAMSQIRGDLNFIDMQEVADAVIDSSNISSLSLDEHKELTDKILSGFKLFREDKRTPFSFKLTTKFLLKDAKNNKGTTLLQQFEKLPKTKRTPLMLMWLYLKLKL